MQRHGISRPTPDDDFDMSETSAQTPDLLPQWH
jgi:hypothetical protein